MSRLQLTFGALCPPLLEQLSKFELSAKQVRYWQKDADAISRLLIHGLISESVAHKTRQKLINLIGKSIS